MWMTPEFRISIARRYPRTSSSVMSTSTKKAFPSSRGSSSAVFSMRLTKVSGKLMQKYVVEAKSVRHSTKEWDALGSSHAQKP